jgi:hypothetical protein
MESSAYDIMRQVKISKSRGGKYEKCGQSCKPSRTYQQMMSTKLMKILLLLTTKWNYGHLYILLQLTFLNKAPDYRNLLHYLLLLIKHTKNEN